MISLAPLGRQDLDEITQVHLDAFPTSSLTALGAGTVNRYYAWLLDGPHDRIALGVRRDRALVGFIFAGVFRGALSGFLHHNRGYLALRLATRPWLLANPLVRQRIRASMKILARRAYRVSSRRPTEQPAAPAQGFGVLAIAVTSETRGGGAAAELMNAAEQVARDRGFTRMQLTVAATNTRAIRFYQRLGWHKEPEGSGWSGVMLKSLG